MPLMGFGTYIGMTDGEIIGIEDAAMRKQATTDAIYSALERGYRHLDLAENYNNLSAVKAALNQAFRPVSEGGLGLAREDIWLTMKAFGPYNDAHISYLLRQVGVDYFDLFLIHNPTHGRLFDDRDSLVAGWSDLAQVSNTKINRIGVSNFYTPHLERLLDVCDQEGLPRPFVNQILLNPWAQNKDLMDYCNHHGIKMMAYSPLGYAYSNWVLEDINLQKVALEIGTTPAQVALAWLMQKNIAVIPKTTHAERLVENLQSQRFITSLSLEHIQSIDETVAVVPMSTMTSEGSEEHGERLSWGSFTHRPH